MARCNHTFVEREESGDCPCCLRAENDELRQRIESLKKTIVILKSTPTSAQSAQFEASVKSLDPVQ